MELIMDENEKIELAFELINGKHESILEETDDGDYITIISKEEGDGRTVRIRLK